MKVVKLRVRKSPDSNWIQNFSSFGWKVRNSVDNNWIQMTPKNTKVRSADNGSWIPVK